jgi:hypothetical protein
MKRLKEIRGTLKEAEFGKLPDPPPVVVLRRIGLRSFPTGERVALYRNDKLNLDVSVPYLPGKIGGMKPMAMMREEIELNIQDINETIIKKLISIIRKGQPATVSFADGTKGEVQPAIAARIVNLTKKANFTNRVGLSRFVSGDSKNFKSVVDFTTANG